ncbi:MFS transporter [Streptomonospora wellingtoniae]|uniref:MFS transporter n=1 Tax=Streptomonospora wellingtoniae TaxID=3075544 RepID=A0ABU2L1E6_9ACTN|nr:MFS transporter [Streptomonospora sp. DSM 45055]MDT0305158.1 MFS transporter [Streptomonospora sp. DSM 45055]
MTTAPAGPVSATTRAVPAEPSGGARAWLVWGIGVTVYFLAMFHRNGLGAAALEAQERFDAGPALLSLLPMLQLLVYVVLQVPTGLLADKVGPRVSLTAGAVLMAAGVALFAAAPSVEPAIAGRVLIGMGDAVTFLNVIRLAALWFPRSRYALVSGLTGVAGGVGQAASVAPLSFALHGLGWTGAFLAFSAVTLLMSLLVLTVVRDRPTGPLPAGTLPRVRALESITEALRTRGPRLGMVHHAAIMPPYTMLGVLWGYPFLVEGVGFDPAVAGTLLSGIGAAVLWVSPLIGALAGRYPGVRRPLATTLASMFAVGWLAVVGWPGGLPPSWIVLAVMVVSAAGAVAAPALSFDFARDGLPAERTGVASGLVNMSGFLTTVVVTVAAGMVLEAGAGFQAAFVPLTATTALAGGALVTMLWKRPPRTVAEGPATIGQGAAREF